MNCFQGIDCSGECRSLPSEESCLADTPLPLTRDKTEMSKEPKEPLPPQPSLEVGPSLTDSTVQPEPSSWQSSFATYSPSMSPIAYLKNSKNGSSKVATDSSAKAKSESHSGSRKEAGATKSKDADKAPTSGTKREATKSGSDDKKSSNTSKKQVKKGNKKGPKRFRKGLVTDKSKKASIEEIHSSIEEELNARVTSNETFSAAAAAESNKTTTTNNTMANMVDDSDDYYYDYR